MDWVKVKDRKPRINQDVLIYTKLKSMEIAHRVSVSDLSWEDRSNGLEWLGPLGMVEDDVMYWTSLPRAPKETNGKED